VDAALRRPITRGSGIRSGYARAVKKCINFRVNVNRKIRYFVIFLAQSTIYSVGGQVHETPRNLQKIIAIQGMPSATRTLTTLIVLVCWIRLPQAVQNQWARLFFPEKLKSYAIARLL
jgi:hypothetical protein